MAGEVIGVEDEGANGRVSREAPTQDAHSLVVDAGCSEVERAQLVASQCLPELLSVCADGPHAGALPSPTLSPTDPVPRGLLRRKGASVRASGRDREGGRKERGRKGESERPSVSDKDPTHHSTPHRRLGAYVNVERAGKQVVCSVRCCSPRCSCCNASVRVHSPPARLSAQPRSSHSPLSQSWPAASSEPEPKILSALVLCATWAAVASLSWRSRAAIASAAERPAASPSPRTFASSLS
jgi:hypothetical protein